MVFVLSLIVVVLMGIMSGISDVKAFKSMFIALKTIVGLILCYSFGRGWLLELYGFIVFFGYLEIHHTIQVKLDSLKGEDVNE